LPDGFFSNQKSLFGLTLEGLRLENVDIFYGHLEYFTAIWETFFQSWYHAPRKIWQPCFTGAEIHRDAAFPSMSF
jgi:hypothetical protein